MANLWTGCEGEDTVAGVSSGEVAVARGSSAGRLVRAALALLMAVIAAFAARDMIGQAASYYFGADPGAHASVGPKVTFLLASWGVVGLLVYDLLGARILGRWRVSAAVGAALSVAAVLLLIAIRLNAQGSDALVRSLVEWLALPMLLGPPTAVASLLRSPVSHPASA